MTHTTTWAWGRAHSMVEMCPSPEPVMSCTPPSENVSVGGKPTCVQLILLCKECSGCVFTVWSYFPICTNQAKPFLSLLTQSTITETQILVSERAGPCRLESCLPSRKVPPTKIKGSGCLTCSSWFVITLRSDFQETKVDLWNSFPPPFGGLPVL